MAGFTESPARRFCDYWNLDSRDHGGFVIATDFHAPAHSALWCNRMVAVAKKHGLKSVIVAGDGLDMRAFSSWGSDPECSWSQEMDGAAEWLWALYHSFTHVLWLRGNHEDRLARQTDWQLQASRFIDAILTHRARMLDQRFTFNPERLTFSNYPHCSIDEEWMVVHPRSYSRIPLRIANQIALIRGVHVIAAHSHRAGWGWADDGKHVIIDTGGMFDERCIQYRAMAVTTHPAWQHGFVAYKNGTAALFSDPPFTDWRQYDASREETP